MTDYLTLSNKLWVKGVTGEPILYYYADADRVLKIKIIDPNGYYVKDSAGNVISR